MEIKFKSITKDYSLSSRKGVIERRDGEGGEKYWRIMPGLEQEERTNWYANSK